MTPFHVMVKHLHVGLVCPKDVGSGALLFVQMKVFTKPFFSHTVSAVWFIFLLNQ